MKNNETSAGKNTARSSGRSKTKEKKKYIVLKGEGLDGENTVQMAQKLYHQVSAANLSLNSLKLLDVYLSKINSHDASHKMVVFEKGEAESLFGVKYIRREALNNQLNELLSITVVLTAETTTEDKNILDKKSLLLFDRAVLEQDKEDGLWKITMQCSNDAEPLIFNIDKSGYLQHALQNSVRLAGNNSFNLYKFIESHRDNNGTYPQTFEISLEKLREALNCTNESYQEYKVFNARILKAGQKEIHEKTDTRFDYQPFRRNNRVFKIRFTIYGRVKQFEDEQKIGEQLTLDLGENAEAAEASVPSAVSKEIQYLSNAMDNSFTTKQVEIITGLISYDISDIRAKYRYLRGKYLAFTESNKDGTSDELFAEFRKIIENDDNLPNFESDH